MVFKEIIGHERQKIVLKRLMDSGKMPHALLFSGQDGIGKKKLAVACIQYMLCERGYGCGECRSCITINRRTHPDVLFVEDDGPIGIDIIRGNREKKITGINEEIYEYPYQSTVRAIIIDQAEMMTQEASNALLKTLEEPPLFNVFFLITSSEQAIPLTIRSRCRRVGFTSLNEDELLRYGTGVLRLDDERARFFSTISCGSIKAGLFWLQEENLAMRRRLAELVVGKERSFLHTTLISEKISQTDRQMYMYLAFLLSLFRDMYVIHHAHIPSSYVMNRDIQELLEWATVDMEWIISSIKKIHEAQHYMRYAVNRWLLLENTLLHILRV